MPPKNPKEKPNLIILNGTSCAGKSTLAKQIQTDPEILFLHFQLDLVWQMSPSVWRERPTYFENRKYAVMNAVRAFLEQGFSIVYDTVTIGEDVAWLRESLKDFDPFIVGVKASLEDINEREKQRSVVDTGLAAEQFLVIHKNAVYDFEVSTSELSIEEAAEKILMTYKTRSL